MTFLETSFTSEHKASDKEVLMVDRAKMIHFLSHDESIGMDRHSTRGLRVSRKLETTSKTVHQLVVSLRHNRNVDDTLRHFLIRSIYDKAYPNRKRITVEKYNWSEFSKALRLKIDSHAKRCNACGKSAYYVLNYGSMLYALRLCFRCIQQCGRELIEQFYWDSKIL